MASRWRILGTVGAVLLLVGFGLAGTAYVYEAYIQGQEISCEFSPPPQDCSGQARAVLNASFAVEEFVGAGLVVGGVGAGCVLIAAIRLMELGPSRSGSGHGPAASPTTWAPPPTPGNWVPPPGPGGWPPPGPGSPP